MQDSSDMYHDVYTQYLFTIAINKFQMCSSQFNLTRMFLNSFVTCFLALVILFHLLVNCLRVVSIDCLYVCRVCFVCASKQKIQKKMVWRQAWREADVRRQTSVPPHLTVWRQVRQLRQPSICILCSSLFTCYNKQQKNFNILTKDTEFPLCRITIVITESNQKFPLSHVY
jgi:hypothetical protein